MNHNGLFNRPKIEVDHESLSLVKDRLLPSIHPCIHVPFRCCLWCAFVCLILWLLCIEMKRCTCASHTQVAWWMEQISMYARVSGLIPGDLPSCPTH